MSSGNPFTTIQDESDTSFDLSTIFSHPAGLTVARYVVGTCIRASHHSLPLPAAETTTHSVPIPTFESSPEVTELLQKLLALNDSEPQALERDNARLGEMTMEGSRNRASDYSSAFDFRQPDFYQPRNKQPPNDFFATSSSNSYLPANLSRSANYSILSNPLHNSLAIQSRSHIDPTSRQFTVDSHSGLNGSLTPGSASPYRIESPSRTSTNNTPQPQFSHSHSNRSSLPTADLFANNDLFQTRLPPLRKCPSNDFAPTNGRSSSEKAYSSGLGHPAMTSNSSSIKSFMPVNKTPEGALIGKPLESDSSPFHQNRMNSNTPSQHTLISTALSRSSSTQSSLSQPLQSVEMERTASNGKKRKSEAEHHGSKKALTEKGVKRIVKLKEAKVELAAHRLPMDLWMRILEFTPPSFIRKARGFNKEFKTWIDTYSSIFVNQRMENYGVDMPPASVIQVYLRFDDDETDANATNTAEAESNDFENNSTSRPSETQIVKVVKKADINERQYNDLLGGKGCLEKGKIIGGQTDPCQDEKASRTHWSWAQRWCWECWKGKIEREDRILKTRQSTISRQTLLDLLACIPNGMHDSFLKPHDYVTEEESRDRPRGAPRLYRYYLKQDVEAIIAEYNKRTPAPYVEDPALTPAENQSARVVYQIKETTLVQKRQDWVDKMKLKNASWMETVKKIEAAVRKRREANGRPHEDYRAARKELFTRRAKEDLPHVPTEFVERTKAYKAATRIFRDGGTERGWQTLKPKIENEWKEEEKKKAEASIDIADKELMEVEEASSKLFDNEADNLRPTTNIGMSYNNSIANQNVQQIAHMQRVHQQTLLQAQHQAQRRAQQAPTANMSSHQNLQNWSSRFRVTPHDSGLNMLATAATHDFSMPSAFNGYGTTNGFQSQSSAQQNRSFPHNHLRYDQHSQNGVQFQYAQFPSNASNMCQNTIHQEPTRGLKIVDLLAGDNSINKAPSHNPTQQQNQHHSHFQRHNQY